MIQLSTLPLMPAIPGARPAGSPLATTSDFALAMAGLTDAIAPPAVITGDTTVLKPSPTLQNPATTGNDLPAVVTPVAIPVIVATVVATPPPPLSELPILEAGAPFVIITTADPLPEELTPVATVPLQPQAKAQPSMMPETPVSPQHRATRQSAPQEPRLSERPAPLPATPLRATTTPAPPTVALSAYDSAPSPSHPPVIPEVIPEVIAASTSHKPDAAPRTPPQSSARKIVSDRSDRPATIPADIAIDDAFVSPAEETTAQGRDVSVDQAPPIVITQAVPMPIAGAVAPATMVPATPVAEPPVLRSDRIAVTDAPDPTSVRPKTAPSADRRSVPTAEPANRSPVDSAGPQPSVQEQSAPARSSHPSPAPPTPTVAQTATADNPIAGAAVIAAPVPLITVATTTVSRPMIASDQPVTAQPATPSLSLIREVSANTIASPGHDSPTTSATAIMEPASSTTSDKPVTVTPDSRSPSAPPMVTPAPVAAPPSPTPEQVVGSSSVDAPAPAPSPTPADTVVATLRREPTRVTFVVAAHTPPPAVELALAPSQPQPAAQVFAAAMFASSEKRSADPRTDGSSDLIASLATPAATAPAIIAQTPADGRAPALDTNRTDWMERMIDRIETIRDTGGASETRIRLSPDALGRVDVAVTRDAHGALQVRMVADTPQAQQLLTEAAPRLAEMAEARGLKLGGSGVDAGSGGNGQRQPDAPTPARPLRPANARAEADTPTDTRLA